VAFGDDWIFKREAAVVREGTPLDASLLMTAGNRSDGHFGLDRPGFAA
jgi:hypothetical protein